jgi:hypothetical protein
MSLINPWKVCVLSVQMQLRTEKFPLEIDLQLGLTGDSDEASSE